ncbi:hypothetical protein [Geodermatophilus sp. SYSU D00079]
MVPQARDFEILCWLARARFATSPQLMRRVPWKEGETPSPQALSRLLVRLQRLGWLERTQALPLETRLPIWQCTRKGHAVAVDADPAIITKWISAPSPATLAHSLSLVDLAIDWEQGNLWLPEDFPQPVRLVMEREILAIDHQAAASTRDQYKGRKQESPYKHLTGMTEQEAKDLAAEPVYGYSAYPGARTRFPDLLLLPADVRYFTPWPSQGWPVGALAVEFEQTNKASSKNPDSYVEILRAYKATIERTRRAGAGTGEDTAKMRGVLYVSPSDSILKKVWAAAQEVGAEDLVLLMEAPEPQWATWPTRTTARQSSRPQSDTSAATMLRRLPKDRLVEYLLTTGQAETAVAALTTG